jgi:hypothetical protein
LRCVDFDGLRQGHSGLGSGGGKFGSVSFRVAAGAALRGSQQFPPSPRKFGKFFAASHPLPAAVSESLSPLEFSAVPVGKLATDSQPPANFGQ